MEEIVILGAARTPIGSFGGSLAAVPAAELGAIAGRSALQRAGVEVDQVDAVTVGSVAQIGAEAYVGRAVGLAVGLPVEVPALTVNRLCGSGLQAIISAAGAIRIGDARLVLAVGTENMSRYPYLSYGVRWGSRLGASPLEDGVIATLSDPFTHGHMGLTAETVAARHGIDRSEQDRFAARSQQRASDAVSSGRFVSEITPVAVPDRRVNVVEHDEHPRPGTTVDDLSALRPAFREGGTVTAGNASGLADGAGAVVVCAAPWARELGLTPRARLVGYGIVGVPPELMGMGPVPAVRKAMARTGIGLADIDLIELNEAFAAQAIACIRELGLDPECVNVNGGAIALGHPIGATGTILVVKLLAELERRGGRLGLVTACIGGGQGIAAIFERLDG